jgi:hypothetical protein
VWAAYAAQFFGVRMKIQKIMGLFSLLVVVSAQGAGQCKDRLVMHGILPHAFVTRLLPRSLSRNRVYASLMPRASAMPSSVKVTASLAANRGGG